MRYACKWSLPIDSKPSAPPLAEAYSNARLWYVVFILTVASTLSFIDRQILNVMIGPIKRDLGGLSDTEVSLIIGLAFSVVYSLSTLPLARLADRYSRRNLIAAGIFSWSLMTALAGMANSFWQLFAARMGVGIGEASLGPATTSMLADYFEQHRLPLAFGIVGAAPFIGTGLASLVGGPLIDSLEASPEVVLPIFGSMYSWQTVLVLVGLPGILLALVMFTVREPGRSGPGASNTDGYSYAEVWEFCKSRLNYLGLHAIAFLCISIQGFAVMTWLIELFVRKHGWTRTEIGISYGSIALVFGIAGSVLAGIFAGRLLAKGQADASMRLVLWGLFILAPLGIAMPLVDNATLAIAMVVPITFIMAMPPGLSNTALQAIAPNRMRGQLIALYLICVNLIAYILAPTIIGVMNDYLFGDESAIDKSLAVLGVFNYSIAILCLWRCLGPLKIAMARVKEFADD